MQKILVVDDDAHIRDVVCFALRRAGYQPLTAGNGRAALEVVAREMPALVVLDILMPELDGTAVCTRLHAREPDDRGLSRRALRERPHDRQPRPSHPREVPGAGRRSDRDRAWRGLQAGGALTWRPGRAACRASARSCWRLILRCCSCR